MGKKETRMPQQQRSIEKRNKILEAGYQLFCDKGYHNTTTAEIAKKAGVSTGIVYSYFKDKKDIFICMAEEYANNVAAPMLHMLQQIPEPFNLPQMIRRIIQILIESHTMSKSMHEEIQALAHTDTDLENLLVRFHDNLAASFLSLLEKNNLRPTNALEKLHIIIDMVETLSHEIIYRRHNNLDYDIMVDIIVDAVVAMLTS